MPPPRIPWLRTNGHREGLYTICHSLLLFRAWVARTILGGYPSVASLALFSHSLSLSAKRVRVAIFDGALSNYIVIARDHGSTSEGYWLRTRLLIAVQKDL